MDAHELADGAVVLRLSKAEALVLFDWIHRFEATDVQLTPLAFVDQAEQRVLWDISASLESVLAEPFLPDWNEIIAAARSSVRDPTE